MLLLDGPPRVRKISCKYIILRYCDVIFKLFRLSGDASTQNGSSSKLFHAQKIEPLIFEVTHFHLEHYWCRVTFQYKKT